MIVKMTSCLFGKKHVPDKGWCWVMLFCSNVIMFLVFGVHYTFGTLYPHLLKEFDQGESKTAWVGSIASGLLFLASYPAVEVCKRTSASTTCLVGAIFSGSGLVATSYISSFQWLYLVYGILFGIGTSFLYTPVLIVVANWFIKYRSLATGVTAASAALGAVVLSPLIQYVIKINGLRNTIKTAGFCYLTITALCAMSYKPLNKDTEKEKANKKQLVESNILAENTNVVKYLLTNRSYWMFLFIMMITNFTYYIPIVHLVYYAERIGVSPSHASFLISIWSISSIVGRIFFGKLMHHFKKHLLRGYQIAMFGSGCVTVMAYFSNRYWMLVTYVITYGFLDGSFIGLISLATLEIVGLNKLAHGYGIMLTFIGLPIAAGPPLIALSGFAIMSNMYAVPMLLSSSSASNYGLFSENFYKFNFTNSSRLLVQGFINDKNYLQPQFMFIVAGVPFMLGSFLMTFIVRWKKINRKSHIATEKDVQVEEDEHISFVSSV